MTRRKKYGEGLKQLMIQSLQHHLWNMKQCDGMSMHGFQWHWVTDVYDDVTEDRSSRKNSEVSRNILSAQIQSNGAKSIGRRFIVQMDDDPKHTAKSTQEFLKVKKVEYSAMATSISWFQPDWACISLAEDKTKGRRTHRQKLKSAAVKAWQSITKEETQSLVMSMSSRLKAVITCKGFSTKC